MASAKSSDVKVTSDPGAKTPFTFVVPPSTGNTPSGPSNPMAATQQSLADPSASKAPFVFGNASATSDTAVQVLNPQLDVNTTFNEEVVRYSHEAMDRNRRIKCRLLEVAHYLDMQFQSLSDLSTRAQDSSSVQIPYADDEGFGWIAGVYQNNEIAQGGLLKWMCEDLAYIDRAIGEMIEPMDIDV